MVWNYCPGVDEGCQGARDPEQVDTCLDLKACAECYSDFRKDNFGPASGPAEFIEEQERTTDEIMDDPRIRVEELGRRRRYTAV